MNKKQIKENLKVTKLINTGLGLVKDNGIAIFIEGAVTNDIIDAQIISHNKNYEKGIIDQIRKESQYRTQPFCPMAKICGGCQWQHITYDYQMEAKREIVEDCLKKIASIDIHVRPTMPALNTKNYRCKVQLPIGQTKVSKRFLAGYYKKNSHEIVNIKHCPIQPEPIDKVVQFFKDKAQELEITAYDETKHKGTIRHLIFRYSKAENNMLLTIVVNDKKIHNKIKDLSEAIFDEFSNVTGVVINFNTDKTNKIVGESSKTAIGKDFIVEKIKGIKYKISAGSFFQVNIDSAKNILDTVKELITQNCTKPRILDAYSGVGTFGLYLSSIADTIVAVEEYHQAVLDAASNIKMNLVDNIELIEGDAKKIFKKLESAKEEFDIAIIDPPRKGCDEDALTSLANLSKKYIVYVSCNPATLARDAKVLEEKGFKLKSAQPVDMFCHTYHIETVAFFEKDSE